LQILLPGLRRTLIVSYLDNTYFWSLATMELARLAQHVSRIELCDAGSAVSNGIFHTLITVPDAVVNTICHQEALEHLLTMAARALLTTI
jgi:hypothetical protein